MPLPAGTRLGPYHVVAPLGAGGMGEVYRARDSRLERDVALKILPPEVATDPARRERFAIEARAVAALSHPNIVAVYDVGDGFIVSELVDGVTLRGVTLGLRKTLDVAAQIASGLAAAHASGIVHRDLKPENVLLTRDGRAKILDFGLARVMPPPSGSPDPTMPPALTAPGMVMGTVGYMSPEQVRALEVDHRSDIFSFGVMLHELLSGAAPFRGETPVDTMQAILRQEAPDLPRSVPASVRQVVSHCLEKDPAHRFQSTRDLSFALQALAQSDSGSDAALPAAMPVPVATRSRTWLWAGAALLVVAAVALGTLWLPHAQASTQWSADQLPGPEVAFNPRRSPDGRLLAFQAMVNGTVEVAVSDPESGNWSVLTRQRRSGFVEYVCWSADGGSIYFSRTLDVPVGIFSVPFLGGEERLVLENAGNPAALPDGSLLVARLNDERRQQMYHFWPDTGKLQAIPVDLSFDPLIRPGIRVSPDGRRAIALGTMYGNPSAKKSLIDVDVVSASAQPLVVQGNPEVRAFALAADATAVIAAVPARALTRIVRIPLDGRGAPEDLFTVTSDVWHMDAERGGTILINLIDRPADVVRFTRTGGQIVKLAHFPQAAGSQTVIALPDGRAVVGVNTSGRSRLMAVEEGKEPTPLIKSQEDTGEPMAAVGSDRIAFTIGPSPRDTIAIADTASGRVTGRISPGKGVVAGLEASPDGATLYFSAAGSIWAVAAAGGEPRLITSGEWVMRHPSGTLFVGRNETSGIRMFEVPAAGGKERAIALDAETYLYSRGVIGEDGLMLVPLMAADSWFNPLAALNLTSGKSTRIAGDGASDLISAAWTRDGRIVAIRQGLDARILTFTPTGR